MFTNWRVLAGIAVAVVGFLVRWALRLWLRWKFRGGLTIG
jgi:hypothetical protein